MDESCAEWVLDSLMGNLREEYRYRAVENLFGRGAPCAELYEQMLEAYGRLCGRLGKEEEDQDCEIMINSLLKITEIVGLKMFEYGKKLSK